MREQCYSEKGDYQMAWVVYDTVNASEAGEPSRKAEVNVSIHAQEMEDE
jgi:hypothetical protein